MMGPILVALEDHGKRANLSSTLRALGYRVIESENGMRTIDLLRRRRNISVALIDLMMSDLGGSELVSTIRNIGVLTPIIVMSELENEELLQKSLKAGAADYLIYPISSLRIGVTLGNLSHKETLQREVHYTRRKQENNLHFTDIITKSEAMKKALTKAKEAALDDGNILIEGEQSTGRETLARIIHRESIFAEGPFIRNQCLSTSDPVAFEKIWNEKFLSLVKSAEGGTLCLSEIDRLEPIQQVKLANYLKQRNMREENSRPKFRLIAISMVPLQALADDELFSKDLLNVLKEWHIEAPSLRDRRDDLADIAQSIINDIVLESGQKQVHGLAGSALSLLSQYDWPGNIGELENLLFRAVLLSSGPLLTIRDFPQLTGNQFIDMQNAIQSDLRDNYKKMTVEFISADGHVRAFDDMERDIIEKAIHHYKGRMTEVSRRLGIGRSTLYRKLDEYQQFDESNKGTVTLATPA